MNAVNSPSESGSGEGGERGGGGVSRAQQHLKENDTIALALAKAVFDRVKRVFFTLPMTHLTKLCYRLFIKTLKTNINLWKMGIM